VGSAARDWVCRSEITTIFTMKAAMCQRKTRVHSFKWGMMHAPHGVYEFWFALTPQQQRREYCLSFCRQLDSPERHVIYIVLPALLCWGTHERSQKKTPRTLNMQHPSLEGPKRGQRAIPAPPQVRPQDYASVLPRCQSAEKVDAAAGTSAGLSRSRASRKADKKGSTCDTTHGSASTPPSKFPSGLRPSPSPEGGTLGFFISSACAGAPTLYGPWSGFCKRAACSESATTWPSWQGGSTGRRKKSARIVVHVSVWFGDGQDI